MLPVQVDAWYRTGASGVAISVLSMALAAGSLASLLLRTTGSVVAAVTGAVLLLLNPNVLYLQSTPMTEPLLFGLTLFSIAATAAWLDAAESAVSRDPTTAGRLIPGLGARRRVPDAVRSLADHGAILGARRSPSCCGAATVAARASRRRAAGGVAGRGGADLLAEQPLGRGRVVRVRRFLRAGERRGARPPIGRLAAVARRPRRCSAGTALPRAGYVGAALVAWAWVRSPRARPTGVAARAVRGRRVADRRVLRRDIRSGSATTCRW